jgi:hypothetical protein
VVRVGEFLNKAYLGALERKYICVILQEVNENVDLLTVISDI